MNTCAIWDNRLANSFLEFDNPALAMAEILEMLDCMSQWRTKRCVSESFYNATGFADWLYNHSGHVELRDMKKEISIALEKSENITNIEYMQLLEKIDKQDCKRKLLLSIHSVSENELYICSVQRYYAAKQWYLARYTSKMDFVESAKESFPHLFFHANVKSSINTLNNKFDGIRALIVAHLTALDQFRNEFARLLASGNNFQKLGEQFSRYSKFECSPQAGRKTVQHLKYMFVDVGKAGVELLCEMHTKLKPPHMDSENQDRIYFHPGYPNVEDGKVLIVFIGTHQ